MLFKMKGIASMRRPSPQQIEAANEKNASYYQSGEASFP